jgi:serine protease Do
MEQLTKTQVVLLVLLVSFITSIATAIVTVALYEQMPSPIIQNINRIVEKTIEKVVPSQTDNEKDKGNSVKTFYVSQEDLTVKIINDISSAVVSVVATKDLPVIEQYFINPFGDEFFNEFGLLPDIQIPQYRQKGTEKRQVSSGTGFFISKEGLLVTNKHVVEDKEAQYSIVMNNGSKLDTEVLVRDPLKDIAILKIKSDKNNFNFISLGNSDEIKVGQTVIAIGNALGEFQNTVSRGVISGLNRSIVVQGSLSGVEELHEIIQTDAAINPGNSGGPLLDLNGKAIGINTAVASGAENIGFALPINIVKKDLESVQKFGKIVYPFLGVRYQIIDNKLKEEKKLSVDYGVILLNDSKGNPAVVLGSPAEKAGLKEGDIILEFGGTKIDLNNQLAELINKKNVGDKVNLKVLRDGKEIAIEVTLEERPIDI